MKKGIFIFVLLITCCSFSDNIRIVSVKPTPQPDNLKLRIIFPKPNSVDLDNKLDIQLKYNETKIEKILEVVNKIID